MKIAVGSKVRVKIKLNKQDKSLIEDKVVEYIYGTAGMLPGIETVLLGCRQGDTKKGVLQPDDAFGNTNTAPKKRINKTEFPADANLSVGQQFFAKGAANGQDVVLHVEQSEQDWIVARLLHPLANQQIGYEVEVLLVSDPVPPPLPGQDLAQLLEPK